MSLIVLLAAGAACNTDDTGKLCGSPNVTLAATPIVGEVPVIEVVDITRDSNCLTFDCLSQKGLPAYCTRSCKYDAKTGNPNSCTGDGECTPPEHCQIDQGKTSGFCNKDDCPAGFFCNAVASVGPLAGQLYCTRQLNCLSDLQCGNAGVVSCQTVGCFGNCLYDPSSCGNAANPLVCKNETELGCSCSDPNIKLSACPAQDLSCTPKGYQTFPSGSVTPLAVCLPQ